MVRRAVKSSNVADVGYDPITQQLEVGFRSGLVYLYFDVPAAVAEGLISASSIGRYLNAHVKRRYRYRQVQ